MPPIKNVTPPQLHLPHVNFRWILRGIVLFIIFCGFISCFTTIPANSVGVLTRFGRFTAIVQPGPRLKIPFGVDRIYLIEVQRQLKLEFGYSTAGATNPYQASRDPKLEENMVTGDLNMAVVHWVVQYRIDDAKKFLFEVRDPEETLRDASESAMREVVGDRTVDEVLTVGRQDVESETLLRLTQLADRYGLGTTIKQVQLKDVHPPSPVQSSFNEVNQAQQEREQAINVANGEYNKAVPRTRGEAEQKVSEAQGYALKRVNEAQGDAERFKQQFTAYTKAPEVTRERIYLETMAEVLPLMERKIILDEKAGQLLPLLPLDLGGKTAKSPNSSR